MVGVGNIVSVGGAGGSGGSGGSGSGIQDLNSQEGPSVTLVGTSGIVVSPVSPNVINIGYAKFSTTFTSITSGIFTHRLDTEDVIVQVYSNNRLILPDQIIIENSQQVSVLFNRPQTGKVVIV